jgi:SAM-dependent methyltransferase
MQQEALWDYYQTTGTHRLSNAYPRLKFLAKKAGKQKILDIGVGTGEFIGMSRALGGNTWGVDPSEVTIKKLKSEMPEPEKVCTGFIQSLPFANDSYDVVVASEVLEHLDDEVLDKGINEIKRVLRPGGRFLMTVPARENMEDSMVVCPCGKLFHRWGHAQHFTVGRVSEILARKGFKIAECHEEIFPPWRLLNKKGKIHWALRIIAKSIGVTISNAHVFCCAVKD